MQETVKAVSAELQNYADRGIFQNFSLAEQAGKGSVNYRFHWLAEMPFNLRLNVQKSEIEIKDVLPAVPFRSKMDKEFRSFLQQRSAESIPSHRRLDDQRFTFSCKNLRRNYRLVLVFNPVMVAMLQKQRLTFFMKYLIFVMTFCLFQSR